MEGNEDQINHCRQLIQRYRYRMKHHVRIGVARGDGCAGPADVGDGRVLVGLAQFVANIVGVILQQQVDGELIQTEASPGRIFPLGRGGQEEGKGSVVNRSAELFVDVAAAFHTDVAFEAGAAEEHGDPFLLTCGPAPLV